MTMSLRARLFAAGTGLLLAATALAGEAAALAPLELRERVDRPVTGQSAAGFAPAVRAFYARRDYRPLWIGRDSAARAQALRKALSEAAEHGLDPAKYALSGVGGRAGNTPEAEPDVELAMTFAYLRYATDLLSGVIDNPRIIGRVHRDVRRPDPAALLDGIASAADPVAYLARLWPDGRRYNALKAALATYRKIEQDGGWQRVDGGPVLRPGARGPRVAQVKRRLVNSRDLARIGDPEVFDSELVVAVRRFKVRHGLSDDGDIGPDALAEMNVPVRDRIEQIIINLERRRWLAAHLGDRYLYLNIADNDVKLVERDHTVHTARVIVGKPYQQTPVFSAVMTQIEINPYWNVPHSIAANELWPIFRRNPGYAAANDYIIQGQSIRQKPGPKNALGSIAFRFPNPYNVYLHDTPAKALFDRESRFFSHGCMRVQFPVKLALLLLAGQDGGAWNEHRINSVIATRAQTFVNLKNTLPVHITYLTAWAERAGTVHFRRDVYRRDSALKDAMRRVALTR
jgi:murein L,D-transpeptidase YcbB/YkuD